MMTALSTIKDLEAWETLFAGLSVLLGGLTLVVGLLQLRRYRRRFEVLETVDVLELEPSLPEVRDPVT